MAAPSAVQAGRRRLLSAQESPPAAGQKAVLALGSDGSFYGTTSQGGSSGYGTVFKVTTNGTLTTLVNFDNTNGATPYARLALGSDGSFYGTTSQGGSGGGGVIFRLDLRSSSVVSLQVGVPGPHTNTLALFGTPGHSYLAQFATNLTTSPWFTLSTNTASPNGTWTVMDPSATDAQRFYRVASR